MWAQYRRSFVRVQIFIIAMLLIARFVGRLDWPTLGATLITMEIFAVFGGWWGSRLKRKIEASRDHPRL